MPKTPSSNKLVNRASGLYSHGKGEKDSTKKSTAIVVDEIDKIDSSLSGLITDIKPLQYDPNNARTHPEKNMEAIKTSLSRWGQRRPILVQEGTNIVVAGNGTLRGARALGWTKIAAVFTKMSDKEAIGYGLADNRTAELAKWDFEVVARLDKLMEEDSEEMVGWTLDELEVLRAADWTPPPVEDDNELNLSGSSQAVKLWIASSEKKEFDSVAVAIREATGNADMTDGKCLLYLCERYKSDVK